MILIIKSKTMINKKCKTNNIYRENNISIDNNDKLKKAPIRLRIW